MALTRAFLKGMGLTDEQVGAIIEEHTNVTSALKDQINGYKEKADEYDSVKKEFDKLKKDVEDNDWKGKYDKEHADFDAYKKDVANKETTAKIKSAYRKLLTDCKVGDKHIDSILRVTDFSDMKLAEDGTLDNAEKLKEGIGNEWSGFITSTNAKPSGDPEIPPKDDGETKNTGRAAQLAAKYHENLYGKAKED